MNKFVFFAGLVHLPHLYVSFQDSQYKHVFAICLPYTDPFRYAQSVVCTLFRPVVVCSLDVRQGGMGRFFSAKWRKPVSRVHVLEKKS